MPTHGPFFVGGDAQRFKDHELEIAAASRHELRNLRLEVQIVFLAGSGRFEMVAPAYRCQPCGAEVLAACAAESGAAI